MQVLVLSQADLCREMVPRAQEAWAALAHLTLSLQMPITLLAQTYGRLDSPQHILAELRVLAATADRHHPVTRAALQDGSAAGGGGEDGAERTYVAVATPSTPGSIESSVRVASEHLHDFFVLKKLSAWLPALLSLHRHLSSIFEGGEQQVEADELDERLRTAQDRIRSSWNEQTLDSLSTLVRGVGGVFEQYSSEQLDLLRVLGESPDLVRWLLEHSSTEEFNRLLQVGGGCCHDDASCQEPGARAEE